MKRFILKTILFSLPIALFYAFPVAVVFLSKEYYPIESVVAIQNQNKNVLYGNVYNTGSFIPYKTMLFSTNDPDVFALGSSRALQIRKEFFNDDVKFVNAGLAGRSISDMNYFVESTATSTKHRVLLLVVDREMFLQDPNQSDARVDDPISLLGFRFHLPLSVSRGMYLDYFLRHKYSFIGLFKSFSNNETLGMRAFADGNGFMPDGSGRSRAESKDPNRVSTNLLQADITGKNILNGKYSSQASDELMISENVRLLQNLLSLCKSRNIEVVGFIPPYMTAINKATFNKKSPQSEMYIDMTNQISSSFKTAGFAFYDLSDISQYNGSDNAFIDIIHGTDLTYAKLSLYLAQHDKTASQYFNIDSLKKVISTEKGDFLTI